MVQAVLAGMGRMAWKAWMGGPLSSRSDEVGVSYEAISTSNRTVQRGSRFAKPRLNGC